MCLDILEKEEINTFINYKNGKYNELSSPKVSEFYKEVLH